jgi:hypothetical protein
VNLRRLALAAALTFTPALAPAAYALDIVACGQVVPPAEHAVLQGDLSCGADGPEYAVYLGKGAKLAMNGHRIIGENFEDGIGCDASCTVTGPGEIGGFEYGISTNGGTITVSDLDIHDCEAGILGTRIRATNVSAHNHTEWAFGVIKDMKGTGVTANDNGQYGFYGSRLILIDSTMSRNGNHGVNARLRFKGTNVTFEDNGGAGVLGGKISASGLTATGNLGGGVVGYPSVTLRDSTLSGNTSSDIASERRPHIKETACGTSMNLLDPFRQSWGICALD